MKIPILMLIALLLPIRTFALPVVPGLPFCSGFGVDTVAGSGRGDTGTPLICKVVNLTDTGSESIGVAVDDDDADGVVSGDLRYCLMNVDSPKTVVFEVSGTINLAYDIKVGKNLGAWAETTGSYITIAGQTAPSPGITIARRTLVLERNTHDILIQHLRFRSGDDLTGNYKNPDLQDTITTYWSYDGEVTFPTTNVVFDHCSFSWGLDENLELGGRDTTLINCIISEGLNENQHGKGSHSKGANPTNYGSNLPEAGSQNIAIIQNLFAHNVDRNPYVAGGSAVVANNYMYDVGNGPSANEANSVTVNVSVSGNYIADTDITTAAMYFIFGSMWKFYFEDGISDFEDDTIVGATSGSSGIAKEVVVTSGSFDNNDAAGYGWIRMNDERPTFTSNEDLDVDSTTVATLVGNLTPASQLYLDTDNYFYGELKTDPWPPNGLEDTEEREFSDSGTDIQDNFKGDSREGVCWPPSYYAMSATVARAYALKNAGARPGDRDVVDARIARVAAAQGETSAIIDTVHYNDADCGGFRQNFTDGNAEMTPGDTVTGATSGETGTLVSVTLESGSYVGGDAAGYLLLSSQSGNFTDDENLQVDAVTEAVADGTGYQATDGGVKMGCCTDLNTGPCVQNDEAGWPALAENTRTLTLPANPHTVAASGYTNLEEWLHRYTDSVSANPQNVTETDLTGSAVSIDLTGSGVDIVLR